MLRFYSVPADFQLSTIDLYDSFNKRYEGSRILETYGQIADGSRLMGSGRASDHIPYVEKKQVEEYVAYSRSKNISFNYTLNATCLGNKEFNSKSLREVVNFIEGLYEIGIDTLTIAIPSIIELIKNLKYKFTIKASTVCNIINPDKAISYKKLGVDKIVVDESINRDFSVLKEIREVFGEKVEVIANVICYKNCIYRMFHHNQMSHDNCVGEKSSTYYSHRCMLKRTEDVSNLLKMNFIRPEDMHFYTDIGINHFKLQGRQAVVKGDVPKTLRYYMEESFDGNLMDLLDCFMPTNSFKPYMDNKQLDGFILPFIKSEDFCRNNCENCSYCKDYVKKCVDIEKTEKLNQTAQQFYNGFDQYLQKIKKINDEE